MKNVARYILLFVCLATTMGMGMHKYYVSVFNLDYVASKKVVRMTSRVFVDDLEAAFVKKYKKDFYLGTSTEISGADEYVANYFSEKVHIRLNGKQQPIKFLGKEIEDDILVCYYTVPAGASLKSIEISNTTLLEMFDDQQNIIHAKVLGEKKSLLLTEGSSHGVLEF